MDSIDEIMNSEDIREYVETKIEIDEFVLAAMRKIYKLFMMRENSDECPKDMTFPQFIGMLATRQFGELMDTSKESMIERIIRKKYGIEDNKDVKVKMNMTEIPPEIGIKLMGIIKEFEMENGTNDLYKTQDRETAGPRKPDNEDGKS